MVKAFLFDYGGVVTEGGGGFELSERLGKALGITRDEAYALLGPVWDIYARGKITEDKLWAVIEKAYGQPIHVSKRKIWNMWEEHMQPLPEMLDLIKSLQAKGYTVGLLSNVIPNTAADIRQHGGYAAFNFLVLSYEVGYAKPEVEIYQLALNKLPNIPPNEVVFVDDQERCLVPARELGIKTILAKNPKQIAKEIAELLKD